jgi:hypothetical protein
MDTKQENKDLNKINYFKNIALRAIGQCVKSYDSDSLSEEEENCLREKSVLLHHIVDNGEINEYVLFGVPEKSYYFP